MTNETTQSGTSTALRILIVEDEPLVSLFLQDVLDDLGHRVVGSAASMRSAMTIAESSQADIALIDIGLAGAEGDGIDAAVALRERHGIPALLMTGASRLDVHARSGRARPLGYLMKPYTEVDVQRALNAAAADLREVSTTVSPAL